MKKKNWKTTLGGWLAAIGAPLATAPSPVLHYVGLGLASLGSILLGASAVDASNIQ